MENFYKWVCYNPISPDMNPGLYTKQYMVFGWMWSFFAEIYPLNTFQRQLEGPYERKIKKST